MLFLINWIRGVHCELHTEPFFPLGSMAQAQAMCGERFKFKQSFRFGGPNSKIRSAKSINHTARTNRELWSYVPAERYSNYNNGLFLQNFVGMGLLPNLFWLL